MVDKIYVNFDNFIDAAVEHKSRNEIAKELVELAESIGVDKEKFLSTIFGDDVNQWLKYHTRHGRQLSVHVTPTVFVNGINLADHSSSWTLEDWAKHIDPLLA
jgi:protein-disulfide isomerase